MKLKDQVQVGSKLFMGGVVYTLKEKINDNLWAYETNDAPPAIGTMEINDELENGQGIWLI